MNIKRYIKGAFKYLTNSSYRFMYNSHLGFYNSMPDEEFIKHMYVATFGKKLNLNNPQTFNEKLQWLKLYNRKPEYTMMVDKYKVREYIAEKLGGEYLIPLLGVWDNPDDINFDELPNQFVLKCNHNSGLGMCICKDKSRINVVKVKEELRKGLAQDYYLTGREWPYKDVPRKIIAEKYMVDNSCETLNDYKVLCFNGKPKLIEIHRGRFTKFHTQDFYDVEWKRTDIEQPGLPLSKEIMAKPDFLEEMLDLSEKLSGNIPHVRVDWYHVDGQLYFGELTFFDGSGFGCFTVESTDLELGNWIELPEKSGGVLR